MAESQVNKLTTLQVETMEVQVQYYKQQAHNIIAIR